MRSDVKGRERERDKERERGGFDERRCPSIETNRPPCFPCFRQTSVETSSQTNGDDDSDESTDSHELSDRARGKERRKREREKEIKRKKAVQELLKSSGIDSETTTTTILL